MDIATGFTGPQEKTRELFGFEIDVPVGYTRSGMEKGSDEQIFALSGIKPETIDIKNTLGFKANDIKRLMGESGKTFTRSIVREVGRNYGKAISNSLFVTIEYFIDSLSEVDVLNLTVSQQNV